jgi:hypothetical protein
VVKAMLSSLRWLSGTPRHSNIDDWRLTTHKKTGHESFQPAQYVEINVIPDARAVLRTEHQSGVLQNAKMLRNSGLRKRKFVHDLTANPRFLSREHPKDLYPCRMADRFCQPGKFPTWWAPPSAGMLNVESGCSVGQPRASDWVSAAIFEPVLAHRPAVAASA